MMTIRPPAFVISLPESVDRRNAMTNQMERLGLGFSFIDAVDGRVSARCSSPVMMPRNVCVFGIHLKGGGGGVVFCRTKISTKIVQENLPAAIIFEDDALISDNFPAVLDDILTMDLDYDVIRFMGSTKIVRKGYRQIIEVDQGLWLGRLPLFTARARLYHFAE